MKTRSIKLLVIFGGICILGLLTGGSAAADELFDTKAADVHFQEGLKLYFKERYEDAIKEFEEAVEIDPENAKAYYHIGYSYYKLKNMPKAMETFEQTYRLNQRYSPIPQTQPASPAPPDPLAFPDSQLPSE
jgi:tetratricopeptide (TPR) repeat protein